MRDYWLFLVNIHQNSFIFIQENALKVSVYQSGGHFVRGVGGGVWSCLSFKNRYYDSTRLVESHGRGSPLPRLELLLVSFDKYDCLPRPRRVCLKRCNHYCSAFLNKNRCDDIHKYGSLSKLLWLGMTYITPQEICVYSVLCRVLLWCVAGRVYLYLSGLHHWH